MVTVFRFILPRRKENLVNYILIVILISLAFYFVEEVTRKSRLVASDGYVWPTEVATTAIIHVIPDPKVRRNGEGENGRPVILQGEEKKRGKADMKKWFMNVVASDKISLDRSLPDTRDPECRKVKYSDSLPTASVVIIFTDEAWSPLMRTVHSVVNRSPAKLLKEVILLDDFSQRDELKSKLDNYILKFGGLVKVVRVKKRLGLIRAKIAGAKKATGDVIVFLDSHCEANVGWLEPLLARIMEKRSAVLCPIIDHIDAETMEYSGTGQVDAVGGFWWSLHFRWDKIGSTELARRKSNIEPLRSPTMAGGLLAIDRKYFMEIGEYDAGMDIWGGENLEISFRVWQCNGTLEFIPCSHVGHIFRAGHPYDMTGPGGNKDVHGTNSKRLAEVWMDDYKRLYYLHRPDLRDKDVGDLSERKALRKRLNCRSFKWYLDNIIPYKFILDENVIAFGAIKNPVSGLCLDTMQRDEKKTIIVGVFSCQTGGSLAQIFSLTNKMVLRREFTCASTRVDREDAQRGVVRMPRCEDVEERWIFENGTLKHEKSGLCLDTEGLKSGDNVFVRACHDGKDSQKWEFVA